MSETLPATDINTLAEQAYQTIAEASNGEITPEEVHRSELCLTASDLMLRAMLKEGASQEEINQVERVNSEIGAGHHLYIVRKVGGEEEVIDPTWQQFLDPKRRHDQLPKVLQGSREQVLEQARQAGIEDATVLDIWRPLEEATTVTAENWRPPIKKAA